MSRPTQPAWMHPPNDTWSGPAGEPNEYDVTCPECGAKMRLRYSKKHDRHFYGCERFPDCGGTHGAHPDGSPLGTPADRVTKSARIRAHGAFDRLWKPKGAPMTRPQAYAWLAKVMGLKPGEGHIARCTREQCEQVVATILTEFDIEVE